jgi:hypothetical protein
MPRLRSKGAAERRGATKPAGTVRSINPTGIPAPVPYEHGAGDRGAEEMFRARRTVISRELTARARDQYDADAEALAAVIAGAGTTVYRQLAEVVIAAGWSRGGQA